jgi:hypothetical protein
MTSFQQSDLWKELACQAPVLVVGSPRSGTTILATSLARHSALWTSDESAYLSHLLGGGRVRRILDRARQQPSPSWVSAQEVGDDEFLSYLGLGLNALYTNRSAGKRWIDQTPLNTLMIDDLGSMFPGASFLHMLRDGRRVVHSMLHFLDRFGDERRAEMSEHVGPWTTDFREACRAWSGYVDAANKFCARHTDRCLTVVNEELSRDPEEGFRSILGFLGLPYEEQPVRHFRRQRKNSSFPTEWRGDHREVIVAQEPWWEWSLEQRRTFVEEAGDAMARAGFQFERDFLSEPPRDSATRVSP